MSRTFGSQNKWRPDILINAAPKLQKVCVRLALRGNETCMRICMDRLYPKLRNVAPAASIGAESSTLAEKGAAIVDAALKGKLSPDVAKDLLAALADVARLTEATETEARLAALEGKSGDSPLPWEQSKLPLRGKRKKEQR